jgi:hypothetical protein
MAKPVPEDGTEYVQYLEGRIRDLEATIKQNDTTLASTFRLTPQLSNLLGLLLSLPVVDSELVRQRLEVSCDAKVAKHRLKQALRPYGIEIHGKRGLGYWLTDADKAKIKALVKPVEGVTDEEGQEAFGAIADALDSSPGVEPGIPEPEIPADVANIIAA